MDPLLQIRCLVLFLYTALFLAANIQVSILLFQYRGEHIVSDDPIILSSSLSADVESMNDVTSISQFGVETVEGLILVLLMTTGAAAILLWFSLSGPPRENIWGALIGYGAVALVGIFGDALPGGTPRRDYNVVVIWTGVSDTITNWVHVISAGIFLFLPILATAWYLLDNRHHYGWAVAYFIIFALNSTYGALDLWGSQSLLLAGEWFVMECIAFGGTFLVYSAFELWRVHVALLSFSYTPVKT